MLIELVLVSVLSCTIRADVEERWAEPTCQEQVINALISIPPTPYDALVRIQKLEREGYENTQRCADLIEIQERANDELRSAYRRALLRADTKQLP